MMRPFRSSSRNTSHVAQRPTRFAFAINTRGASAWVVNTPTGFPDCTSNVSSSSSVSNVRHTASNDAQSRTALPVPPYTTRSCGRSATSGSRLFMSIRRAASWIQPLQDRSSPRGARSTLGPVTVPDPTKCPHSYGPRIELPRPHACRHPFDIGREWAVAVQRRHVTPDRRIGTRDAPARRERLQVLEPLRGGEQLDRDDPSRVRENP